jgi:hypothetical protein
MNIMEHKDVVRFQNWINVVFDENIKDDKLRHLKGNIAYKLKNMLTAIAKDGFVVPQEDSVGPKIKPSSGYRDTGKTRRKRINSDA